MDATYAETTARELMFQHGLHNWQFEFDHAVVRFGRCSHSRRTISLSRELVQLNTEAQVRDTILHEIAHALVGPGHGHGRVWKLRAASIGAKPERCYDQSVVPVPRAMEWTGTCQSCGKVLQRMRRPSDGMFRSGYHSRCRRTPMRGVLIWKHRGELVAAVKHPSPMLLSRAIATMPATIATTLSQSDISELWDRLNKLEGK
jgi:predicted SprT family Zn-dependent metalloprotease